MKQITILLILTIFLFSCSSEVKESSDKETQKKTEVIMQEANKQIGMPAIVNFQEKKLLKQVYELRDQENVICHAYFFNEIKGEIGQYLGKCLGYGIPYSTQFSNPEKKVHGWGSNGRSAVFTKQAEPNGLFIPEGLSATWLFLLDKKGEPHPVYVEPSIIVSPFKLH